GRMMNEPLGKVHFALTFIAANCVFFPMHILGTAGLRRRIPDITATVYESPLLDLNRFISISAFVLGTVQLIFIAHFFYSLFRGPVASRNPWNSNSLEWTAPSPPGHGNFDIEPVVYRWPYDYGHFGEHGDHLMQNKLLNPEDAARYATGHH